MKKLSFMLSCIFLIAACSEKESPIATSVGSDKDSKIAYAQGYDLGQSLKRVPGIEDLDQKTVFLGMLDGLNDNPQLSDEERQQIMMEYSTAQRQKQAKESAVEGEKNKIEGEEFLAENAKKDGVITTKSGLQYKIITPGNSKKPKATDKVEVHYKGTFIDGSEFDSSYKRGETITFPLNGVIKGWTEGLQLIGEGGKIELAIPYDLAYGANGRPGIGPFRTLLFEVELVKVNP